MNAPNRADEVKAIVREYPETFQGPAETVDDRKRELLPIICRRLNQNDGANAWGLLKKTEQGNKIPADIIVWRQTMEHFDVLTDSGAMWGAHGPVTVPTWVFEPVGPTTFPVPEPTPQPQPGQPPSSFEPDMRAAMGRVEAMLKQILEKPDPVVLPPDVEFPNYEGETILPLPAFLGGNRPVKVVLKPKES